jgi:hypothetical protein
MFELKLIAAGLWEWLIPAVFIVIYLLNHLFTAAKAGGAQRDAQQRRRPPAGERPLRPQPPPQQAGQSQLNAEIEQFLKRANERRMEKTRREGSPTAAPKPPQPPLVEQAVDVEPLERRDFDAVAASVQQHLGSRGFQQRAEHLGDDVEQAEGEMERHLQEAFSHKVGTLGSAEPLAPPTPVTDVKTIAVEDRNSTALALAGILANQQNIKQAIMLKEILERPIDRW